MDSKDFTGCGDGIWTTWPSGYEKIEYLFELLVKSRAYRRLLGFYADQMPTNRPTKKVTDGRGGECKAFLPLWNCRNFEEFFVIRVYWMVVILKLKSCSHSLISKITVCEMWYMGSVSPQNSKNKVVLTYNPSPLPPFFYSLSFVKRKRGNVDFTRKTSHNRASLIPVRIPASLFTCGEIPGL